MGQDRLPNEWHRISELREFWDKEMAVCRGDLE